MSRTINRLVRAGRYVAEVEIERIPDDNAWGPYISLDDAFKLERVEKALVKGDLATAASLAKVYELSPIAAK